MQNDSFRNFSIKLNNKSFKTLAKQYNAYFVFAFGIGIIIRIVGLDFQSLWLDELYSVLAADHASFNELFSNWLIRDPHPPLYSVFLYYWVKLFGDTAISVRLPSAVAGALSIYFIYIYTKRYFEENIASMASILIALSYVAIYYSQEARSYSFLILFSIISTFHWLRVMLNRESNKKDFIKYCIIITVTSYIHYFGLLLIIVQLLYWHIYSIYYFRNVWLPMLASLALLLLYAPWLYIAYEYTMGLTGGVFWIPKPTLWFYIDYIAWLFTPYLLSIGLLIIAPFLIDYSQQIKNLLAMVKNNSRLNSPLFAISCLLFVSAILPFVISLLHTPMLTPRNLLIIAPLIYVFVSFWISMSAINKNKQVSYVFFSCLICLFLFLPDYYANPHKQQWREAVDYTIQNATDATIVVTTLNEREGQFNYYFERHPLNSTIKAISTIDNIPIKDTQDFHNKLISEGFSKLFLLEAHTLDLDENIIHYLIESSYYYHVENFIGVKVHEFLLKPNN